MREIIQILKKVIVIVLVVICIYLLLPIGDAGKAAIGIYTSLGNSNAAVVVNRKVNFVSSYTYTTGDITLATRMGYTEEQAEVMLGGNTGYNSGTGAGGVSGTYETSDGSGLGIAKAIASTFTESATSSTLRYALGGTVYHAATVNGVSYTAKHRDCSGLVGSYLYFTGRIGDVNVTSSLVHNGSFGSKLAGVNQNSPASVLQEGDILWKSGHVGICVHVDGSYAYIADAGDTAQIERTAADGYAWKLSMTDLLSSWRNNTAIEVWRITN